MFPASALHRCAFATLWALVPAFASAWDSVDGRWSVNGFGTLGAAYSDEERADYLPAQLLEKGPGRSDQISFAADSRAAVQVSARPLDGLSGVVQVIAEQRPDGSYAPHFEWVNLQYAVTPDLDVRVGRTLLNPFLASAYRKVGYAMPWVRPPTEVYRLSPITTNDGVDLTWQIEQAGIGYRIHGYYGSSEFHYSDVEVEAKHSRGVAGTLTRGPLSINLAWQRADITVDTFESLAGALRQFGPVGSTLADRYVASGSAAEVVTAGIGFDPGRYFLMAEWASMDGSPMLSLDSAWYLSGGYRFRGFTPYLTFARSNGPGPSDVPDLPLAGLPPEVAAIGAVLNAQLDESTALTPVQETVSAGLRWDAFDRVAFKLQYDRVRVLDDTVGTFINLEPGYRPDGANLLTLTMDWVF